MGPMNDNPQLPPYLRRRPELPPPQVSLWTAWSPLRIVALAVMLMAGDFALQIIFYALGGGLFLPVLLGTIGGVFVPLVMVTRAGNLPLRHDFSLSVPSPLVLFGSALMAVAALSPTSLLAQFSLSLHPADPQWASFMAESMPTTPLGVALAALTVVVAAPLAEELIFRGLVHRLASGLWGRWPAAVVSALIFGIVHGEPWYLFGLIGIGLVLAVVYEATGSVVACWVTHMVHNGISLALMLGADDPVAAPAPLAVSDWLIAGASVVALVLLGGALMQHGTRLRHADSPDHS